MSRHVSQNNQSFGAGTKLVFGMVAAIMLPPFIVLAIAPMVLMLLPVAFVAIPFMVSAFAGEAHEVPVPNRRRVQALRPATVG